MSQRYCFEIWRDCIHEIEGLLKEASDGPRSKDQLARAYLRHLQVMRRLDQAHALLRQPQQREAVGAALAGAAGLTVEAWAALVAANDGVDVLDLVPTLLELKLTPEDLEVRVPAGLRRGEPPAHARLRAALAAAATAPTEVQGPAPGPTPAVNLVDVSNLAATRAGAAKKAAHSGGTGSDPAAAATEIQAAWRRWRDFRDASQLLQEEERFLGMAGAGPGAGEPPAAAAAAARRARRAVEYEAAKGDVEATIQAQEAPFMALEERSKVLAWLERHAVAGAGRWPEVPVEGELPAEGDAAGDPSAESMSGKTGNGRGKKAPQSASSSLGKVRPSAAVPALPAAPSPKGTYSPALASTMERLVQQWKKNWAGLEGGAPLAAAALADDDAAAALEGLPLPRRGSSVDAVDLRLVESELRPRVRQSVARAVREEARGAAAAANAALPPPAPPSAQKGGARAKDKEPAAPVQKPLGPGEVKKGKAAPEAAAPEAAAPLPPPEDPAALFAGLAGQGLMRQFPNAAIDDFLGEGALAGPAAAAEPGRPPAAVVVNKVRPGGKAANGAGKATATVLAYPEMSLAAARQLLALQCALPLAALAAGAPPPAARPRTALVYGPSGSGKNLMVEAIASEAGAAVFDLSPAALMGKYLGKAAEGAVAAVFAAARAAAPAVVHVDEVEKIFVRDEKRSAQMAGLDGQPPCRLRRQLVAEAAALRPEDGVLVLATSAQPHACMMADEDDFVAFFDLLVALPLPDHRSRRRLVAACAAAAGMQELAGPQGCEQLTLAAHLTEGLTAGQLRRAVGAAAASWAGARAAASGSPAGPPLQFVDVLVAAVAAEQKPTPEELSALRDWTARAHWMKRGGGGAVEGPPPAGRGGKAAPEAGRPAKPAAPRQ